MTADSPPTRRAEVRSRRRRVPQVSGARIAAVAIVLIVFAQVEQTTFLSGPLLAMCAACVASVLWASRPAGSPIALSTIAVFIVALATVSVFVWSETAIPYGVEGLFSLYAAAYAATVVASRVPLVEVAFGLIVGSLVVLAVSLAAIVTDPDWALIFYTNGDVALRGAFRNRNLLAYYMLVGLVSSVSAAVMTRRYRIASSASVAIFVAAVVASSSATTIVIAGFVLFATLVALVGRSIFTRFSGRAALGAATASLALAASGGWLLRERLFDLLLKESTLSGRTEIWLIAWEAALERPVLGYGWASVWNPDSLVGARISESFGVRLAHSHSIYLEFLLYLGFIGLAAAVVGLAMVVITGLQKFAVGKTPEAIFLFLFATALALHGISENMLLRPSGLFFFFLLLTCAGVLSRKTQRGPVTPWIVAFRQLKTGPIS